MGKFSYHSNNSRNFYSRSEYPGVSKRRWNERQKQRKNQRLRKDMEQEMYEEAVAAAAAAAENGPSPAQRLRRVELLAQKDDYLKKFTASHAKEEALLVEIDAACARYEIEVEKRVRMENEYHQILSELDVIPAEVSSSRMGLSETGNDIMEEVGGNVVKKEGGGVVKKERGIVVKNENEAAMNEKGVNVPKEGGEGGSAY